MPLGGSWTRIARDGIRVNVRPAIRPGAAPGRIIDEHAVLVPREPIHAPAPRRKGRPDGHSKSEADGASNEEAGPRRSKHDQRVVIRNHDEGGIRRQNRNVWAVIDDDLWIRSQIPVV